jgi:Fic-DOC domain mobile mystery protein B
MADEIDGTTPVDDTTGLLQPHLTTRGALNAVELESISKAYDKYIYQPRRKPLWNGQLSEWFIRQVHRDMFGTIWDWAGKYRTTVLNIGADPPLIQEQIQVLCGDFNYWISSTMSEMEIAARLQNRLTRIHPFKDGNGRHARLMTDIFFDSRELKLPVWPQIQLMTTGNETRKQYINAMRTADKEDDYSKLMKFIEDCIQED